MIHLLPCQSLAVKAILSVVLFPEIYTEQVAVVLSKLRLGYTLEVRGEAACAETGIRSAMSSRIALMDFFMIITSFESLHILIRSRRLILDT